MLLSKEKPPLSSQLHGQICGSKHKNIRKWNHYNLSMCLVIILNHQLYFVCYSFGFRYWVRHTKS